MWRSCVLENSAENKLNKLYCYRPSWWANKIFSDWTQELLSYPPTLSSRERNTIILICLQQVATSCDVLQFAIYEYTKNRYEKFTTSLNWALLLAVLDVFFPFAIQELKLDWPRQLKSSILENDSFKNEGRRRRKKKFRPKSGGQNSHYGWHTHKKEVVGNPTNSLLDRRQTMKDETSS